MCGSGSGCRVERTGRRSGHSDGTRAGPGVRISLPFRNFPARRSAQCARFSLGFCVAFFTPHAMVFFSWCAMPAGASGENRPRRAAARRPVRSPEPAVLARADCGAVRCAGSSRVRKIKKRAERAGSRGRADIPRRRYPIRIVMPAKLAWKR